MSSFLHVKNNKKNPVYQRVSSENSVLEILNFEAKRMKINEKWTGDTEDNEYGIVLLGGHFEVV